MTPLELTEARESLHLSQVDLARALGVAANTVNRWESGSRAIPPYLWLALSDIERQRHALRSGSAAMRHLIESSEETNRG